MKLLNITMINMVDSVLPRISAVSRWNGTDIIRRENIADHSFGVAIISGMIAEAENDIIRSAYSYESPVDIKKVFWLALWHDVTEIYSGDINFMFKRFDEDFSNKYDETLKKFSNNSFFGSMYNGSERLDDCFPDVTSKEFRIVNFCDMFQLLSYCISEYRKGNKPMQEVIIRCQKLLEKRAEGIIVLNEMISDLNIYINKVLEDK